MPAAAAATPADREFENRDAHTLDGLAAKLGHGRRSKRPGKGAAPLAKIEPSVKKKRMRRDEMDAYMREPLKDAEVASEVEEQTQRLETVIAITPDCRGRRLRRNSLNISHV